MIHNKRLRSIGLLAFAIVVIGLYMIITSNGNDTVDLLYDKNHQLKIPNDTNDRAEFEKWRAQRKPDTGTEQDEEAKKAEKSDETEAAKKAAVPPSKPHNYKITKKPDTKPQIDDDETALADEDYEDGDKRKAPTPLSQKDGSSLRSAGYAQPKLISNGIAKPKPDNPDLNKPEKFLGGSMKAHAAEQNINGNIMEEEGDEEFLKNYKSNNDAFDADTLSSSPASIHKTSKLGVPIAGQLKEDAPPIVKEVKPYPEIENDFSKITIKPFEFRIYSHNVKNGGHDVLVVGEESWSERYRKITTSIKFNARPNSIVTLQEVYKFQMLDIMEELNMFSPKESPEWAYFGEGRIDGNEIGEFVPILYRPSEWDLVFSDTIWLNDRNIRKSYEGWDAKYLRIMSYVTLKHKASANYINVFNTHLDHTGEDSRIGSAEIIATQMQEINKWPSFLCGDLNAEPSEETISILRKKFVNSADHVTPFNTYGHVKSTVTGFDGHVLTEGGQSIDYIFAPRYTRKIVDEPNCAEKKGPEPKDTIELTLQQFGMLHSKYNGVYISDHRPIAADFSMGPRCYR